MRMVLCNKCGVNMIDKVIGTKLAQEFKDKCQICGKVKMCSKWDFVIEDQGETV